MTEVEIDEYREYERFAQDWADDDVTTRQAWQLLGQLEDEELLIRLAEQKVGFVDGATPTAFVGRITRDTDDAILFSEAAAVPPLLKLAHPTHQLENGIENAGDGDSRRGWLEDRLADNRWSFE